MDSMNWPREIICQHELNEYITETRREYKRIMRELKDLERLRSKKRAVVVTKEGVLVTVY